MVEPITIGIIVVTYIGQLYNCNIFEMVLQGCHGGIFSLLSWNHFQNPFKLFTISITSDMIRLFLLFEGNFFQNLSLNIFHRGRQRFPGIFGPGTSAPKDEKSPNYFWKKAKVSFAIDCYQCNGKVTGQDDKDCRECE